MLVSASTANNWCSGYKRYESYQSGALWKARSFVMVQADALIAVVLKHFD